ncbi:hypothetical protein [Streptomyces sp. H39-C1]|nr:hypothetical protein [Streptomyces sp. H39-C1]MCZ4098058.1 hypothetical protein [Streptomyces sp. H39-C1]
MVNRPLLRRLARIAVEGAVRGGAAAVASAPIQLAIWWITHK